MEAMKERSDFVEIEVKALPKGKQRRVVELAQASAPPGWRMVRKPHVAFFDLYFDTPGLILTKQGDHLRARFGERAFKGKGRYKLFFKERGECKPDDLWLSRREVRTDLRRTEILEYANGGIPGLAASLAYERIARTGGRPNLVPVCLISTFRRYFTMRSPNREDTDCMNVGLEWSTAFAMRGIDLNLLINEGFIDGPDVGKSYDFELAEAELTVENVAAADAAFRRLVSNLKSEFELTVTPKYERCLKELGLNDHNIVA
jgi:hypothetical protein